MIHPPLSNAVHYQPAYQPRYKAPFMGLFSGAQGPIRYMRILDPGGEARINATAAAWDLTTFFEMRWESQNNDWSRASGQVVLQIGTLGDDAAVVIQHAASLAGEGLAVSFANGLSDDSHLLAGVLSAGEWYQHRVVMETNVGGQTRSRWYTRQRFDLPLTDDTEWILRDTAIGTVGPWTFPAVDTTAHIGESPGSATPFLGRLGRLRGWGAGAAPIFDLDFTQPAEAVTPFSVWDDNVLAQNWAMQGVEFVDWEYVSGADATFSPQAMDQTMSMEAVTITPHAPVFSVTPEEMGQTMAMEPVALAFNGAPLLVEQVQQAMVMEAVTMTFTPAAADVFDPAEMLSTMAMEPVAITAHSPLVVDDMALAMSMQSVKMHKLPPQARRRCVPNVHKAG